jgi:ABC-2 type transport system ATP-binding protein
MALTAEHLIIIGRGRLIADVSAAELTHSIRRGVRVRSPQAAQLCGAVAGPRVTVTMTEADTLEVDGLGGEPVGRIAHDRGIVLYELVPRTVTLEEAFMELTHEEVEYRAQTPAISGTGRSR